jgi:hypothetical protein
VYSTTQWKGSVPKRMCTLPLSGREAFRSYPRCRSEMIGSFGAKNATAANERVCLSSAVEGVSLLTASACVPAHRQADRSAARYGSIRQYTAVS